MEVGNKFLPLTGLFPVAIKSGAGWAPELVWKFYSKIEMPCHYQETNPGLPVHSRWLRRRTYLNGHCPWSRTRVFACISTNLQSTNQNEKCSGQDLLRRMKHILVKRYVFFLFTVFEITKQKWNYAHISECVNWRPNTGLRTRPPYDV